MRVSVVEGDPGYTEDPRYDVYLDGVQQHFVYTADEELGFISRALLYDDGWPLINADGVVSEEVYGVVKLVAQEPDFE